MFRAFVDGRCRGNPGPGAWGAFIVEDGQLNKLYGSLAYVTNNQAELWAIIMVLRELPRDADIEIVTNSTYILGAVANNWRRRRNSELLSELTEQLKNRKVRMIRADLSDPQFQQVSEAVMDLLN